MERNRKGREKIEREDERGLENEKKMKEEGGKGGGAWK